MALTFGARAPRRRLSISEPPNFRIVLLGKSASECSRVGNSILGRSAFGSEAPSDVVDRVTGRVEDRCVTLIYCPQLLQTNISDHQITETFRECVYLCDPGPHAFIITLQYRDFTEEDMRRVKYVLNTFSEEAMRRTIIITTDKKFRKIVFIEQLSAECGGGHLQLEETNPEWPSEIFKRVDEILKENQEQYLTCEIFHDVKESSVSEEQRRSQEEKRNDGEHDKGLKTRAAERGEDQYLRIVLIGRTGSGKSATGNTILGRNEFHSQLSTESVTTVCEKKVGEVDGRSVAVVDTPGLFDTKLNNKQISDEIMKCVSLLSPGPHVFLIVLIVGRFTKEESDTLDLIKKVFGPKAAQFSIVLFTRGDDLQGETIEDFMERSKSAELKKLIGDCGNRFMAFNNREKQDRTQVTQLLEMIEEVKNTNQGRYFTNSMFWGEEITSKKRMKEIKKEIEREKEAEIETLKDKHDREMKDIMKRFEDEKQKTEKHFREKEQQLRKEFKEKEETEKKKRETEYQNHLKEEKQLKSEYQNTIEELKREIEIQRSKNEKLQKDREEEEERERWKRRIKEAENERKEKEREYEEKKLEMKRYYERRKREDEERREEERKTQRRKIEDLKQEQDEENKRRETERRRREEEEQREYEEKKQEIKRHYEQLEQERKEEWERRKQIKKSKLDCAIL